MMRRGMVVRPRRGLIGAVATTAVVAGTATVTSNAINNHARNKAEQQQAEAMAAQQQQADAAAAQQAQAQAAAAPAGEDMAGQLQKLVELKNAGVLNPSEFEAAKAKLLA